MNPEILYDFNELTKEIWNSSIYDIETFNAALDRPDTRSAKAARVVKYKANNPRGYEYKLRWKGDKEV
jgi:hypothetical protein